MSQVETVARAMFESEQDNSPITQQMNRMLYGTSVVTWEHVANAKFVRPEMAEKYRRHARVAIKAMRVPTKAMLDAGTDCPIINYDGNDPEQVWQAMCDVALIEGPLIPQNCTRPPGHEPPCNGWAMNACLVGDAGMAASERNKAEHQGGLPDDWRQQIAELNNPPRSA